MCTHLDLVDTVAVSDMYTSGKFSLVGQDRGWEEGSPELESGVHAIEELVALWGVAERDVMAVGRHHCHRYLLAGSPLHGWCSLALEAFEGVEHVFREEASHDVWAFHIVVFEVHKHLVANLRFEVGAAAGGGHRGNNAYPWGRYVKHRLLYIVLNLVALSLFRIHLDLGIPHLVRSLLQLLLHILLFLLLLLDDRVDIPIYVLVLVVFFGGLR